MSIVTSVNVLTKQPNEKRKYSMSFEDLMDDNEIISSIISITSEIRGSTDISDLVITNSGINSGTQTIDDVDYRSGVLVEMWIESGINGNTYRIECLVNTNASQILEGDGLLKVKDT